MLAGMAVASSLQSVIGSKASASQGAALISLWGLERKLQDLLLNEGVPVAATASPLKTIVTTLPFCDLLSKLRPGVGKTVESAVRATETAGLRVDSKTVKAVAGIMVDTIVKCKDAWAVAGINSFDNVLWFNQELMSEALWYAVAVPAFIGGGLSDAASSGLESVSKTLATAQKKSQYRADELCRLLPSPLARESKVTKTGAKKTGKTEKKGKRASARKSTKT